jgi:hypothetical protein
MRAFWACFAETADEAKHAIEAAWARSLADSKIASTTEDLDRIHPYRHGSLKMKLKVQSQSASIRSWIKTDNGWRRKIHEKLIPYRGN